MCLTVKKPFFQRIFKLNGFSNPLIADRDIPCIKYYYLGGEENIVKTIYTRNVYDLNKPLPEVKIRTEYYDTIIEVHEGYHSYDEKVLNDVNFSECGSAFNAVIPKGSLYYKGKFNGVIGYASNNLKILNKIENEVS